jgi:hypothetical protein
MPVGSMKFIWWTLKMNYHTAYPSWDCPAVVSRQRVFPSPQKQGGGGTLACGWGVGGSPNSDEGHTLWYSLYVRTLCFTVINQPEARHSRAELWCCILEQKLASAVLMQCSLANHTKRRKNSTSSQQNKIPQNM